jgi:hypothetical protein
MSKSNVPNRSDEYWDPPSDLSDNEDAFTPDASVPFYTLPPDVVIHICRFLDVDSLLALYATSRFFKRIFDLDRDHFFWCFVCHREGLWDSRLFGIGEDEIVPSGYKGDLMRIFPIQMKGLRKVFLQGMQMRRNLCSGNFRGWRIFANERLPITPISPDQDVLEMEKSMGVIKKMEKDDIVKVDWEVDYTTMVVFHHNRSSNRVNIWVYDFDFNEDPKL